MPTEYGAGQGGPYDLYDLDCCSRVEFPGPGEYLPVE